MGSRILVRVVSGPDAGLVRAVDSRHEVGRGSDADLRLDDPTVSRRHAIIEPREGGVLVVDTGSSAGTRVDRRRATSPLLAMPGSTVKFGETVLIVLELRGARRTLGSGFVVTVRRQEGDDERVAVRGELILGRDHDSDLRVDHSSVSRRHAVLRESGDGLVLVDLDSANGTRVNGHPVRGERLLLSGDTITLGSSRCTLTVSLAGRRAGAARHLLVRSETGTTSHAVEVSAPPDARVSDVVAEVATFLGLGAGARTSWRAYVAATGTLLLGGDRWADVPLPRGETLTIAAFADELDEAPEDATSWPDLPDPTVNTPPRASAPPSPTELKAPTLPEGTELKGRGVLWQVAGGAVAVVAAGVVAVRFPNAMLFAVVAALAGLATVAFGLLGDQSRRRHGVRTFFDELVRLDDRLAALVVAQGDSWRALSPGRDEMRGWVRDRGTRLWERRPDDPDFLRLRLGVGRRSVLVKVEEPFTDRQGPYAAEVAECVARHRTVADVPVTSPSDAVLGLAGPRAHVTGLACHAVVEACVLHAPSALQVVVVSASPEWSWVRWLPHVGPAAVRLLASGGAPSAVEGAVQAALARAGAPGHPPRVLLVLGQGASSSAAAVAALEAVRAAGGLVLVLDDDVRALPPECDLVCRVDNSGQVVADGPWADGAVGPFEATTMSPAVAAELAVELGRLRDPRLGADLRSSDRGVLQLSGVTPDGTAPDLGPQWADRTARLESVFGEDDQGLPVTVDLRRDGPHGVIAGTTGSGKSELLLSFLGSLIARHPPERLVLFLIDFKGGATFTSLRPLPHVVGFVTDLDGSERLSERAFTALDAEITRRKRVLAQHAVADLAAYERLPGADPMPSLLVVIDEFALLVTEQPGVKARLDAVAAQGRSLGIHLLLATQSPGGVITPAIRANTNIWLCLRVVSDAESLELLGARDAAQIPTESPGRAFLRRGAERSLSSFQTARITRSVAGDGAAVTVRAFGEAEPLRAARAADARATSIETELDTLVAAAVEQHVGNGSADPFDLWVPPLPPDLDAEALDRMSPVLSAQAEGLVVRLGLADEPHLQRQRPWDLDLSLTNLLVSGVFRSGRTTAVRRVIEALTAVHSPERLHLYVIDARGTLREVEALPHTGGYAGVHDRELLVALFDRVTRLVERRRETGFEPGVDARVVLVLDDYPAFREVSQTLLQDRLNDQLLSLAAQGRAVGVHVVLTCGQVSDLRVTFASHFQSKLLLRQAEPADYVAIDQRITAAEMPPDLAGRGMTRGGLEVQVANAVALQDNWVGFVGGPSPLRRLPADHLSTPDEGRSRWPVGCVPVGIGGDDGSPVWLGPRHGPHLLVLGESLTGRSTALRTVALRLLEEDPRRRVAVAARRPATLEAWRGHPRLLTVASGAADFDDLLAQVERCPDPVVLVVDDAEGLGIQPGTGDRLDALLRGARDTGLRAVVAARTADWPRLFDPWARYLTSLRVALFLAPTPESGLALDVRLPATVVPMVPGRGFLVAAGSAEVVQVSRTAAVQAGEPAS